MDAHLQELRQDSPSVSRECFDNERRVFLNVPARQQVEEHAQEVHRAHDDREDQSVAQQDREKTSGGGTTAAEVNDASEQQDRGDKIEQEGEELCGIALVRGITDHWWQSTPDIPIGRS